MAEIFLKNLKTGMILKTIQRMPNYGHIYSLGWIHTNHRLYDMINAGNLNTSTWVEVKVKEVPLISGIVYNHKTNTYIKMSVVNCLPTKDLEWAKITRQETIFIEDKEKYND